MQVVQGKEHLGRLGFVEWFDIEFVLIVETRGNKVLYFWKFVQVLIHFAHRSFKFPGAL
jgi:hypothetical protein